MQVQHSLSQTFADQSARRSCLKPTGPYWGLASTMVPEPVPVPETCQYQPHTELYMKSISGAEATGRCRGNCLNRFPTKPGQSGWDAEDISCSQPIQCLRLSRWGAKRVCMRLDMFENIMSGFGATTYSSVTSGWANH